MRRARTTLILLLALLGGALLLFKGKRYEVVISQEAIDAGLAEHFPATKKYFLISSITYSNPQVTLLEEEDRVQVGLDALLNIRINDEPRELGGGVTITSGIRYDSTSQAFFLDDAVFDRLEIQGVPESWLTRVTDFAAKAAREFVEKKPIYRLEAKDAKTAAATLLLKGFEVHDQAVYVTLGI